MKLDFDSEELFGLTFGMSRADHANSLVGKYFVDYGAQAIHHIVNVFHHGRFTSVQCLGAGSNGFVNKDSHHHDLFVDSIINHEISKKEYQNYSAILCPFFNTGLQID